MFNLEGEQGLTELTGERFLFTQEEVTGDLHGDGAGTLTCSTRG